MTRRSKSSRQGVPERAVDVVLSDLVPNMSGMDVIDHAKSSYLGKLALDMAERVLKPHGHALIKVSQDAGFQELVKLSRSGSQPLPKARSAEMYLLAMDFRLV